MANVLFLNGLEDSNRVLIRAVGPRGVAYELHGSIDIHEDLRHPQLKKHLVVLGDVTGGLPQLPRPDVIFNCITDADTSTKALHLAMQVIRQHPGVPVINRPVHVLKTRRDDVAAALAAVPGLVVPATQRIRPTAQREVLDAIAAGPGYPVILRSAGTHGGASMLLLRTPEDAALLDRIACDGSEYYLIRFIDFASPDGLYRKLRLVFVGDQVFARHLLVSEDWNVHASTREGLMAARPELCAEEEAFLTTFGPTHFPPLAERLAAIKQRLQLDYFSVDCALLGTGELLIFEANASGNALRQKHLEKHPYLRPVVQKLRVAVQDMLLREPAPDA
ncbi:MAG: hypothetical protein K0S46_1838 [Moraxellaceae bacterium]|nr:hypothetical protein [Moraxellaceae bacterium]